MIIHKILSKVFGRAKEDVPQYVHQLTGLAQDKRDDRDIHAEIPVQAIKIPDKYVIPNMPPVRNQGPIGSCASHAAVAAYEILLANFKPRQFVEGSELYHYYHARKDVNKTLPKDGGMSIRDACKTLAEFGAGMEYVWPYIPSKYNDAPNAIAESFSSLFLRMVPVKVYERFTDLESIKASIAENKPVLCGIPVYENYYDLNAQNATYKPNVKKKFTGGHAQLIVGYDNQAGLLKLRNSWGSTWGDAGYCYMTEDDFVKYGFDSWRVVV